jgi:hypothetical protein
MNKHVFKKIAELEKTQLSEVNVELALIDDFNKEINEGVLIGDKLKKIMTENQKDADIIKKMQNELDKSKKDLQAKLNLAKNYIAQLKAIKNRTDKSYIEIVNKASQLGFDYPKSIDTNKNILDNYVKSTECYDVNIPM